MPNIVHYPTPRHERTTLVSQRKPSRFWSNELNSAFASVWDRHLCIGELDDQLVRLVLDLDDGIVDENCVLDLGGCVEVISNSFTTRASSRTPSEGARRCGASCSYDRPGSESFGSTEEFL